MKDTVAAIRQALNSHPLVWLRAGDQAIAVTPTLGGRIAEWHAGGRQWLTWPMPEDFRFPAPAGYMEIPGHTGEAFRCRVRGNRLFATARLANGLEIRRVYTLESDGLRIESAIRNRSEKTVDWSWGGRTFLLVPGPGAVEFDAGAGPVRVAWNDIPRAPQGSEGARSFEQKDHPIGEWRVLFDDWVVTHRFAGHPFIRTKLGRGDARQGLVLYVATDNMRTAPGDGIAVKQELRIERKRRAD
jgi:hypothetical protein